MSDDKSSNKAEKISNVVSKVLQLKESNPKVLFGAIGALVVVILILMMSGGSSVKKGLTEFKVGNISIGQTYELRGVNNRYDVKSTIRLVSVPGSLAAYDDTEAEDRKGGCKHMPQGTKVKVTQVQKAFKTTQFAEVEMLAGECAGHKGWTFIHNLK
ncbi:MAG: hypothetical protein HFP81_00945 [Methylococcales symbiont of Hymedesmia sp. n. MRB-2018]|nr:MAG: hypothetical protein HFP78_00055 [Methylococcales symbiont of Hymedesmia sp. n. MRB-2018]KAF3984685.1 MAG: hypothetical protein HFP81_00945 [Methylococcales symbiont of Hymedesmia sp. n. MRB-2018]